jgi:site-specific DNA recombinase
VDTPSSSTLTGRECLRVSHDKSGRARSIDEQHADNVRAAEQRGIALGEPYIDVDRSASRYARKAREGFDRLIADLRAGTFGADFLILWEASRGSRQVGEWVTLIELLEKQHIEVLVTTHNKTYSAANARDRRSLLEDALDAQYESDKSSERVRRAHAANAAAGKPHGPVAWGYARRYDPVTKAFLAQEIDETQASMVRELFDRLERGHSFRQIARDFEKAGYVARNGKPWPPAHLRDLATRPVYAGLRQHRPKGATRTALTPGCWPAIIPPEQFWLVQRRLTAPERTAHRPGQGVHLLSMIAVCDACSGPMSALRHDGTWYLRCREKGCARIPMDELDQIVTDVILGWLAQPGIYESLRATTDDAELAGVRSKLAAARAELTELEDEVRAGRLSARFAAATVPGIEERISGLEREERDLLTPSELAGLIDPDEDLAVAWENMLMPAKRRIARLVLVPGLLGQLRVAPVRRLGRRSVATHERVRFVHGDSR